MYFITQIEYNEKTDELINDCRGYFSSFKDAENVVVNNITDLYESCFNYVVIENIPEGLYQYDIFPRWYLYNKETGKYEETSEPEFTKNYVGFALG